MDGLHGDLSQNQRERILGRFREGEVRIIVATDVAARGIDVDTVTQVINYDVPTTWTLSCASVAPAHWAHG